jgi:hypothetical protein
MNDKGAANDFLAPFLADPSLSEKKTCQRR